MAQHDLLSLPNELLIAILDHQDFSPLDALDDGRSATGRLAVPFLFMNRRLHAIAVQLIYPNALLRGYESALKFVATVCANSHLADLVETLCVVCQVYRDWGVPASPLWETRPLWQELGRRLPPLNNCHNLTLDLLVHRQEGHRQVSSALTFVDVLLLWAHSCPALQSITLNPFLSGLMNDVTPPYDDNMTSFLKKLQSNKERIPRSLKSLNLAMARRVTADRNLVAMIWRMCPDMLDTLVVSTNNCRSSGSTLVGIQVLSRRLRKLVYDGIYSWLDSDLLDWYENGFGSSRAKNSVRLERLEHLRWPIGLERVEATFVYRRLKFFDATVGPFSRLPESEEVAVDCLKADIVDGTFPSLQTLIVRNGGCKRQDERLAHLREAVKRVGLREVCIGEGIAFEVKAWAPAEFV